MGPTTTPGLAFKAGNQANAWQIHDTLGNVEEWCHDWYADYTAGAVIDREGPPYGETGSAARVLRGCAYDADDFGCVRAAYRNKQSQGTRSFSIGFRVARTIHPPSP